MYSVIKSQDPESNWGHIRTKDAHCHYAIKAGLRIGSDPMPPDYETGVLPLSLTERSSQGARTLQSFRVKDACALRENRGVTGIRTLTSSLED